jgi:hypothetical protein
MRDTIIIVFGTFIGAMIYMSIYDYRFYKRHRITTPEQDREVRSWSFTPIANIYDALLITALVFAFRMAYLQFSG